MLQCYRLHVFFSGESPVKLMFDIQAPNGPGVVRLLRVLKLRQGRSLTLAPMVFGIFLISNGLNQWKNGVKAVGSSEAHHWCLLRVHWEWASRQSGSFAPPFCCDLKKPRSSSSLDSSAFEVYILDHFSLAASAPWPKRKGAEVWIEHHPTGCFVWWTAKNSDEQSIPVHLLEETKSYMFNNLIICIYITIN